MNSSYDYCVNAIDTKRTDMETMRGIRVGATREDVLKAYPEIYDSHYWNDTDPDFPGADYLWYCDNEDGWGAAILLIPAKKALTQEGTSPSGTTPINASMLIFSERAKCEMVSSFGFVFPRSKSEMLRSVVPSLSASSICVKPRACRALHRAAPNTVQMSCISSPFPIVPILI